MALSPERRQYLADLANDEWLDRLDRDVPNDDQHLEAMSEAMARAREQFVREATDPEELHAFAAMWNWDGDRETILAVTRNPACDAGTALMIYWYNGPEYYGAISRSKSATKYDTEGLKLHSELEARLLADTFPSREISYDPRADGMVTGQTVPGEEVPLALYNPVGKPNAF